METSSESALESQRKTTKCQHGLISYIESVTYAPYGLYARIRVIAYQPLCVRIYHFSQPFDELG
jgi:hypothetical protein